LKDRVSARSFSFPTVFFPNAALDAEIAAQDLDSLKSFSFED